MLVWTPQDQGSAIVIVDDSTLEPIATQSAPRLITPTPRYHVGHLKTGGVE